VRRCAAAFLAAGVLLIAPAAADAYRIGGPRWPGKTITYANDAPRYSGALKSAVRAWNRARIGIKFKRAPKSEARVVLEYGGEGGGVTGCEGVAGATPGLGNPGPAVDQLRIGVARRCRRRSLRRLVVAHELGHVLGLAHDDRHCQLMNSRGDPSTGLGSRCPRRGRRARRLRRKLVTHRDAAGARKLYRRPNPRFEEYGVFFPEDGFHLQADSARVEFSAVFRNSRWRYRWDFGDASSGAANRAEGPQPVHLYARPGSYVVTLVISRDGFEFARQRHRLTFSPS
jgi:hypothetical protein